MAFEPLAALGGLKRSINSVKNSTVAYLAMVYLLAVEHAVFTPDLGGSGALHTAKQVGTVIQAGVIGLAIILIILVYDQVQGSLPAPTNTDLSSASTNATSTFAQAMELAPVIIIVLLAAVVIAVVQRFRS